MPTRRNFGAPSFSLPRLKGVALAIVVANVALSFLAILSQHAGPVSGLFKLLELVPAEAVRGYVWQIFTYAFFDLSALSLLFSSFALWSFGAMLEAGWGPRRFATLYFGAVIFAGLTAIALSYTRLFGTDPTQQVYAAWGGVFGLLGAYGTEFADQETFLFPFPTPIKAKWLALVWIGVALFMLVAERQAIFLAELGGALYGYLWVKVRARRGMDHFFSERYFGLRNRYHRWKRRRAARKFEVYMRKHDRSQFFDQYGNFKPPEDRDKKSNGEGGQGRWVQ